MALRVAGDLIARSGEWTFLCLGDALLYAAQSLVMIFSIPEIHFES